MSNDQILASILFALNRESDYERHVYEWQTEVTHRIIAIEDRISVLTAKLDLLMSRLGEELVISFNDLND